MSWDDLGIVVIGRNEGQRLKNCLSSLSQFKGKIIYVDSGSTDDSVAAAQARGALVVRLDMATPFTAARARNEGFAVMENLCSDAQYVQFIDGDCELADTWLDTALAFIKKRNDVAVVCGRRRERHPERSVYNMICDIEWDTPLGETLACGGDSLMRVDAFKMVNGFQPKLIAGEEPELCSRLRKNGWKVWRIDAEMTRHDAAITQFRQWWSRAVRGGYAACEISLGDQSASALNERTQVARAVFWAGLLPLIIAIAALFKPAALFAIAAYPLQVSRIAIRRGVSKRNAWIYALFMLFAKFAELQGILKYLYGSWRKRPALLIEYKK